MPEKVSDRYHHIVYWSDEDQIFVGRVPELFLGGVHGDDPEKVLRELREVAEDVVAGYLERGEPLPEPSKEYA